METSFLRLPLLLAGAAAMCLPARAAIRSGANHAVSVEVIDSGGSGISSASYSVIGSIGGIAGTSSGSSSQLVAGYIGKLDLQAPELELPSPVIAAASDPAGVAVTFSIEATDDLDPDPTILAVPASGSLFPLGDTLVEVSATDDAGNRATGSFAVKVLSPLADTDGDGLNDSAEFFYAPLGFDWQVGQPALVGTLFGNANVAGLFNQTQYDSNRVAGRDDVTGDPNPYGLYTPAQVQALNLPTPIIQRNPGTGEFTLIFGIEKSTTLLPESFAPFPMTAPQTQINGEGKVEFRFTASDNAAFFRIKAE